MKLANGMSVIYSLRMLLHNPQVLERIENFLLMLTRNIAFPRRKSSIDHFLVIFQFLLLALFFLSGMYFRTKAIACNISTKY